MGEEMKGETEGKINMFDLKQANLDLDDKTQKKQPGLQTACTHKIPPDAGICSSHVDSIPQNDIKISEAIVYLVSQGEQFVKFRQSISKFQETQGICICGYSICSGHTYNSEHPFICFQNLFLGEMWTTPSPKALNTNQNTIPPYFTLGKQEFIGLGYYGWGVSGRDMTEPITSTMNSSRMDDGIPLVVRIVSPSPCHPQPMYLDPSPPGASGVIREIVYKWLKNFAVISLGSNDPVPHLSWKTVLRDSGKQTHDLIKMAAILFRRQHLITIYKIFKKRIIMGLFFLQNVSLKLFFPFKLIEECFWRPVIHKNWVGKKLIFTAQ